MLVALVSLPARAQGLALGTWHGDVITPTGTYALLFQLRSSPDTGLSGDLESVNQAPGEKLVLTNIVAEPAGAAHRNYGRWHPRHAGLAGPGRLRAVGQSV